MKTVLRYFLINLGAIYVTTQVIRGLSYDGGLKTLLIATAVFTIINMVLIPLLKILLLPLNLLTLGIFSWIANVLGLYFLTRVVPDLHLSSFYFPGFQIGGFTMSGGDISAFWTVVLASFMIGVIIHFFHWLVH